MNKKIKICTLFFSIIIFTLLNLNPVFSICYDSAVIVSAEFSLNDNSFSYDYDGNSGIIERITRNESTGLYELWQTSLLSYTTDEGANYYEYGSNSVDFDISSDYNSKKNRMLVILNTTSDDNFVMYLKLTLKNVGTCDFNNDLPVSTIYNSIRYYGVDSYSAIAKNFSVDPYPEWRFSGVFVNDVDTKIFTMNAMDLIYKGKLQVRIGPDNVQKVDAYFWIDGKDAQCGDGFRGYGELCDDGNTLNGDYCSADCSDITSVCGDGIMNHKKFIDGLYYYYNPTEYCDSGIVTDYICTNNCTKRTSVCGNGKVEHYYYLYNWILHINPEKCDKGNNNALYNCSDDCTVRYSSCGNGVTESTYAITDTGGYTLTHDYFPKEECDDGPSGSASCTADCIRILACGNNVCEIGEDNINCPADCYVAPIVERVNYKTNVFIGTNLTPGQNVTYYYNVTNKNYNPIDLNVNLRLYNYYPYTNAAYPTVSYAQYHNSTIKTNWVYSHYNNEIIHSIPPNCSIIINQSVIVPDYGKEFERTLRVLSLHESINYRPTSLIFGWKSLAYVWRGDFEKGLGSIYPQYCINYLEPDSSSLVYTTNEEGVPAVEITYNKGIVRSYRQKVIPVNTFFLNTSLQVENNTKWSTVFRQNAYINKTFVRSDNDYISINQLYRSELEVIKTVSFPIYDYEKVNNKQVRFKAIPYFSAFNTSCNLRDNAYISIPILKKLNLIAIDIDAPIILRPNGGGGYDNLYSRFIFFNYKNYSLYNVKYNISFSDLSGNPITGLFDYEFENVTFLPAGAAYPIAFNIKYVGPSSFVEKQYKMTVNMKYVSPTTGLQENWSSFVPITIIPTNILGTQKFVDLIPVNLNYTLVNLNNVSKVGVKIANQGTANAGNFEVKFYLNKGIDDINFIPVETKIVNGLNAGNFKEVEFSFIPDTLERYILKVVVDEDNDIFENNTFVEGAEKNNVLTSITMVRNMDVVLDYVYPDMDNAANGIIPFKVFARNKGNGGIDNYEIKLTVIWEDYTHTDSFFFYSIPEEGYENTFYWNVTNVPPRTYRFVAELKTMFDPDISDNFARGGVVFCPLPWDSSVTECYTECDESCVDKFTNRYKAYCDGVNRCQYYNKTFALACNGYTKGSYVTFNETYSALCPDATSYLRNRYINEGLDIQSVCRGIFIEQRPVFFNGNSVIMDIVNCIE